MLAWMRTGFVLSCVFGWTSAFAALPTNPVTDRDFMKLPNGRSLSSIKVGGVALSLSKGAGGAYTARVHENYLRLKRATQSDPQHAVQWALMDLDQHRILDQSLEANRKVFGASTSKIFVGGALLNQQQGQLSASQLQKMADMLVVSSNSAWTDLQNQIGGGSANKGRERIHNFTQGLGYARTRGFQGYWGAIHGNELTAAELVEYLHDTYKGRYAGAETLWKLMHTCRTGSTRARKYIPQTIFVGGKTGTYDGPTENPETGKTRNPDGSQYTVRVRNHAIVFYVDGHQYALAVLANTGLEDSAALLAGGLIREFTSLGRP